LKQLHLIDIIRGSELRPTQAAYVTRKNNVQIELETLTAQRLGKTMLQINVQKY